MAAVEAKATGKQSRTRGDPLGLPRNGQGPKQNPIGPVRPVEQRAAHLDPTVHRAGVKDGNLAWQALMGETKPAVIALQAGEQF